MTDPYLIVSRKSALRACCILLLMIAFFAPVSVAAEATPEADRNKYDFTTDTKFGGPSSAQGQLEDDDRVKEPAFRFPGIYDAFEPWRDWKKKLKDNYGFSFTGHYASMYQGLSSTVPGGDDSGASGVLRLIGSWELIERGTPNSGSLVVMLDHRHAYNEPVPADLAGQAGYIGITGTFFNDIGGAVVLLNWQQRFNDGNSGVIIGRYDPNDYMNILGYVNPWVTFSNLAVLLEPSVAFPDSSWGVGAGHWFNDQWYVLGGVNDANGLATDNLEFFDGGSEFFKYAHIGWSPSKDQRYYSNVHFMVWDVDERVDAGIDSARGFAVAANWTFDGKWMPFLRAGWSDGNAPIYNKSATIGLVRKFKFRSDLVGISVNWGDPPDNALPEQTTIEAFWNIQIAQNLALTPDVQLLLDPALNPEESSVWVFGLRARLTF